VEEEEGKIERRLHVMNTYMVIHTVICVLVFPFKEFGYLSSYYLDAHIQKHCTTQFKIMLGRKYLFLSSNTYNNKIPTTEKTFFY